MYWPELDQWARPLVPALLFLEVALLLKVWMLFETFELLFSPLLAESKETTDREV